ncbi:sigma-70 family RNA polymerase sigma factor [Actinomadura sp. 6K520]|uniref:sigma-70 family RNA polymerase sigma factor n=1 Tax=Actinomadura sp. 6K520 TaxID=2530364 RepID=UPI001050269B|nr:sigma-70 family RNA polymerase sigma factor [Actinomadura sp. 6K520]TDE35301.1 sigma-70 family RNA polymerase sigma factor [Actinomadura sp. 6K520]
MVTVDRAHYARLLRLAYLVLDDGDAPLTRARRAAARAARGRPGGYPAGRARLVAVLLTEPPGRRYSPYRILFEPAPAPRGPVREALAELAPHERLACLLRLDGLTVPEVAAELGPHRPVDFRDVERATAALDARTGLDAAAQRAEIEAFEPDLVRLRPPAVRPAWRAAVAVAVAVAVLAAAGSVLTRPGEEAGGPAAVDARAWRETPSPSISQWPAQGALRHDAALLRRAADAWRAHHRHPPAGRVFLLYAGTVDGASLVVLRDTPGARDAPSVAQYFERRLSRGVESVRRLRTGAGQLIMLGMTWRYLVPPWLRDVRAAVPQGRSPEWMPLAVRDGLSDRLPWNWFTPRCQNHVVFRMTFRPAAGGTARAVTQLASHDPWSAAPRVWFPQGPEPGERFRWAALHAVACEGAVTLSESGDLRLGRLWSGELPDGGGRATLLTVDASSPWATPGTAVLISDGGRVLSERGETNSDTTASSASVAAALWWRSPRRWHLLAAGGPRVTRLRTVGELGPHEGDPDRPGEAPLLMVPGPRTGGPPPERARLPVVHVVAYETDGDRTVISPW